MRRTKIVCTIGPASEDPEVVRALIQAGMDVARINFSHGDPETHARTVATIRRVAREEGRLVALLADLQGPKLRVGDLGEGVELVSGETVVLAQEGRPPARIPVPHSEVLRALQEGQRILLDDGRLELVVEETSGSEVRCRVVTGGRLRSHKGLNLPNVPLDIPALTAKDREDVRFALEQGMDLIALSFVRSPQDVLLLRRLLHELGRGDLPIIAKIEKPEALAVFDDILTAADGIMVARGDLGVETRPEEVPFHQKRIIAACNRAGKPVITATQMLQSMIQWPTPTRAEASDVANAILDGTDAVMLSGETAIGAYPVEAARVMATICVNAEAHLPQWRPVDVERPAPVSVTEAISEATVEVAAAVGARAILTATMSGTTARMVARHRPSVPIIGFTPNRRTLMALTLVWGVIPLLIERFGTVDEMMEDVVRMARREGYVHRGERVVLTAGVPFGGEGRTNMLKVHVVGEEAGVTAPPPPPPRPEEERSP